MPVRIAANVDLKRSMKPEPFRNSSRRKTRLSVYLTSTTGTNEAAEKTSFLFNESDVQSVLEIQQERKKKKCLETGGKLKLVWKGTYKPAKSQKESLAELLAQCNASRKVRFSSSIPTYRRSRHSTGKYDSSRRFDISLSDTGSIVNSYNHNDEMDLSESGSCRSPLVKTSTTHSTHQHPSVSNLGMCRLKRVFRRNAATDHQEHHMFTYRMQKKMKKKKLLGEEKQESIDSSDEAMKMMQLEREKLVPELKYKVDVDTILRAYLSEEFLDLNLEGEEAASLRLLYESTIANRPVIHNLIMKHPDMLPSRIYKDLVNFKKGFEVNPIYTSMVVKCSEGPWRDFYFKSLSYPTGNILIELERDVIQYTSFYKTLLEARASAVKVDNSWIRERKSHSIRENLIHLAVCLRIGRQNPGSAVRFDVLQIFEAASHNECLLRQLGLMIEGWLNQLVHGLQSPFKSVRDETCQVLCIMTSTYPVMKELYLLRNFDVVQDVCLAVLRAIDRHEDTFPEYFILLAHFIHYCPSGSIIECIIDRWQNFRDVGLILQWPRLIYYALRYWPDDVLGLERRLLFMQINKALEAALQRQLTAKVSRHALYYLQVRFRKASHICTIYYKESAQSRFLKAHAERRY